MNNEQPTPETDAASMTWYGNKDAVQGDFARKLERERDKALAEAAHWKANHDNQVAIKSALIQRPDLGDRAQRIEAIREAIRDAHAALDGCLKYMLGVSFCNLDLECETMDKAHHALAKLQPFIKQ